LHSGNAGVVIGQHGARKTIKFRLMLHFIKPTHGTITWTNDAITNRDRQNIGFLPEERGLYQKLSIEQQVVYFAALHGMSKNDAKQKLKHWMTRLDVVGKVTDKVQSLSK